MSAEPAAWLEPPPLCVEIKDLFDDAVDGSVMLTCVLPPEHLPPHWDDHRHLYWHQPAYGDEGDDDDTEGGDEPSPCVT